jgi:hypothetical protein
MEHTTLKHDKFDKYIHQMITNISFVDQVIRGIPQCSLTSNNTGCLKMIRVNERKSPILYSL